MVEQEKTILEDYILNKIKKYTLVMLIQGETQTGKSTLVHFLMNNLSLYKFGIEWDYKKFCARNLVEFVNMVNTYDNQLLVFEEATKDISIDSWYDKYNHLFNVLLQTQGYKHNLLVLVFPSAMQLSNRNKYFIKLGLTVLERIDEPDTNTFATRYKPTIYYRDFWRLEEHDLKYLWWNAVHFAKYTKEDLEKTKEYTKWLEEMKKDTMKDIINELRQYERKNELRPKCVVCGSKVGIKKIGEYIFCKFHEDYA